MDLSFDILDSGKKAILNYKIVPQRNLAEEKECVLCN